MIGDDVNPSPSDPPGSGANPPELDALLRLLTDRAHQILAGQTRLQGLIEAGHAITGDLDLETVLRRIVEAARDVVGARYAALGVIDPSGTGLEQFVHTGMDKDALLRIGHLPQGKGLLGALIDDPRPIRLADLAADPRSTGFPNGHPPMRTFLGVPIRVRHKVFGNLYLADRAEGEFTEQDRDLVSSLAATAGIAIENARLFAESRRRAEWLQASTEVTRQLMTDTGEEPLALIARRVQELAGADAVNVVLPVGAGEQLMVEVATGHSSDTLTGLSYPAPGTLSKLVLDTGRPVLIADMTQTPEHTVHLSEVLPVGALMAVPLVGGRGARGALLVVRLVGRAPFDDAELQMTMAFAGHAAVALELADARSSQQRIALLEDRDRIARDLHDHVIQRLFAAGLTIESIGSAASAAHGRRLARVVEDIDETIRQIRSSIFQLRSAEPADTDAPQGVLLAVATEVAPILGFEPRISFIGPVDIALPPDALADVVAVIREALTNVARHAQATRADIDIVVDDNQLIVDITDNGVGLGDTDRRSGLANLRTRAERHGGTLTIHSPLPPPTSIAGGQGTSVRWIIPVAETPSATHQPPADETSRL